MFQRKDVAEIITYKHNTIQIATRKLSKLLKEKCLSNEPFTTMIRQIYIKRCAFQKQNSIINFLLRTLNWYYYLMKNTDSVSENLLIKEGIFIHQKKKTGKNDSKY